MKIHVIGVKIHVIGVKVHVKGVKIHVVLHVKGMNFLESVIFSKFDLDLEV